MGTTRRAALSLLLLSMLVSGLARAHEAQTPGAGDDDAVLKISRRQAARLLGAFTPESERAAEGERVKSSVLCFCLARPHDALRALRHTAATRLHEGRRALRARQFEQAEAAFTAALRIAPQDPVVVAHRGLVYAQTGRYRLALQDLSRALLLAPGHADLHYVRGLVHLLLDDPAQARTDLIEAARRGYAPAQACLRKETR